jgi:hypothetical protein
MELGVGCPLSDLFPVAAKQLGFPSDTQFDLFEDPFPSAASPMETAPLSVVFQLKQGHPLPTSSREWQQRLTTIPIDHWAGPPAFDVECTFHPSVSMNNWSETDLVFVYEYNNSATPKHLVRVPRSLGLPGFREFMRSIFGLEGRTVLLYDKPFLAGICSNGTPFRSPYRLSDVNLATTIPREIAFRIVEGISQKTAEELIDIIVVFSEDSYRVSRRTSILAPFGSSVMSVRKCLEECGFLPVAAELFFWSLNGRSPGTIMLEDNMTIDQQHFEIRFDILIDAKRCLVGQNSIWPVYLDTCAQQLFDHPFCIEVPDMQESIESLFNRIAGFVDGGLSALDGWRLAVADITFLLSWRATPFTCTVKEGIDRMYQEWTRKMGESTSFLNRSPILGLQLSPDRGRLNI